MRRAAAVVLTILLGTACSAGQAPAGAAPASPSPAGSPAAGAGGLTQDACRVLTAADVQAALGPAVTQLPLTSSPPGAGPGDALVSGCTYASATATPAGVSLYLYRDLPIDYLAGVTGFRRVPGVGDTAYQGGPMLLGRKGHVTFQLSIDSSPNPAGMSDALVAMARAVAGRL
jgi:hypothetical protein